MHRRTFFTLTAAAAVASTMRPLAATAGEAMSRDLRGMDGQLIRLPSLDVESNQEFLSEVRTWVQRAPDGLMNVARKRAKEILQENGFSPDAELPAEQVIALMENDTTMMASARAWLSTQALSWRGVKQLFDAEQDFYLTALHDAEKKGPGTLELNRSMVVPNYARHEIHAMPGGYVGDPLAGYVYHYGTNAFYMGDNDQDEIQVKIANAAPIPSNGKVRRILDIGCGVGQTTVALKRRFPDAEVWGIDVGGPMVHYAHMRATDLGVDVNFRQGLAEASGFPDGHFDMVVSYILLHEVPSSTNTQIMQEVARLLRPGGNYYPVDFFTASPAPKSAYRLFHHWWDHRWNNEVWAFEHMGYDLVGDLERFGMAVDKNGPGASLMGGPVRRPNLFATRRA
jgi:SAM-dependent methyltransferase